MRTSLSDELLPYHELKEALSVLSGRLDAGVDKQLQARRAGKTIPRVNAVCYSIDSRLVFAVVLEHIQFSLRVVAMNE